MRHRMELMRLLVMTLIAALVLAGCASGPPKRIYPPQASIQEISLKSGQPWTLMVRVQNFSTVPMHYDRIEATLSINGHNAGAITLTPNLSVGPGAAEIFRYDLVATPDTHALLEAAQSRSAVRYRLEGRIHSSEPRSSHPFEYESALNPVPGLTGVLR